MLEKPYYKQVMGSKWPREAIERVSRFGTKIDTLSSTFRHFAGVVNEQSQVNKGLVGFQERRAVFGVLNTISILPPERTD